MLELLAPAGSPESVIAAVQNGADAVYMGMSGFNARKGAKNFSDDEFEKAVRYCRIRGCKTYLTLNTLVSDREIKSAVELAGKASELGVDALIVQDLGLASVIRRSLPDIPLHASTQMSIHNLAGVQAAAEAGCTRAVLARELNLDLIKFITKNSPIETEVFVHGALCFCHSGQCYMSSLIGRRSGNRGMCAQPCRQQYSLGGRMDDYPLSLKDQCLVEHLLELEEAGVACAKIEGRMRRPEYTAIVTGIYSRVLKERTPPTEEELKMLEAAFSRQGFTKGYYLGNKKDMHGIRDEASKPGRETEKLFTAVRKQYADSEVRRVPLHFLTVCEKGRRLRSIAFDDNGNKAIAYGPMPERALRGGVTETLLIEQMQKTGGTPYIAVENKAKTEPDLFVPSSSVNDLRRQLIADISKQRATPPQRRRLPIPGLPESKPAAAPKTIVQVSLPTQLSEELAELKPDYIYFPLMSGVGSYRERMAPFLKNGTIPVAVLPRIITDDQTADVEAALELVHSYGVEECLIANSGHMFIPKKLGIKTVRADFGLNMFNSYTGEVLRDRGFASATASFESRISQIRDMSKALDTEMFIYGRFPLMVSDQCIMYNSSKKHTCATPGQLADRTGNIFPVMKEFGCRNVIYNAHKLFLADRTDEIRSLGLWGVRFFFTTEQERECVDVLKSYMGLNTYRPNVLTRGLYYRGVD